MSDDDLPPLLDESELVEKIINRNQKRQTQQKTPKRELLELEKDDFVPELIKADLGSGLVNLKTHLYFLERYTFYLL